jgi:hypothetical protein
LQDSRIAGHENRLLIATGADKNAATHTAVLKTLRWLRTHPNAAAEMLAITPTSETQWATKAKWARKFTEQADRTQALAQAQQTADQTGSPVRVFHRPMPDAYQLAFTVQPVQQP